jgi:hypothetical protein
VDAEPGNAGDRPDQLHVVPPDEAGLVTERGEGNRILHALAEDRLAACIGRFLSAVCPEQILLRHTKWRPGAQSGGS